MQKWKKKGLVFCPNNNFDWMKSHAAVPIADQLEGDLYRVYFSCRDRDNKSNVGFVDINIKNPWRVLNISSNPVLSPGPLGCFDDSGCMGTCILSAGGRKFFYYIGWNLGVTVPFRNSIGLAEISDNGMGRKLFDGPILDRTRNEPHFCASCCVLKEGDLFRIWYLSCVGWELKNNVPLHKYHIKYAESIDGIAWDRKGKVCIDFDSEYEYAISVPRVLNGLDGYEMWFSSRGSQDASTYRIRYATSGNGIDWCRRDNEIDLDVSTSGWDSDMIEYPYVFRHEDNLYMLYNGNGYGKTGFGIAVLEQ